MFTVKGKSIGRYSDMKPSLFKIYIHLLIYKKEKEGGKLVFDKGMDFLIDSCGFKRSCVYSSLKSLKEDGFIAYDFGISKKEIEIIVDDNRLNSMDTESQSTYLEKSIDQSVDMESLIDNNIESVVVDEPASATVDIVSTSVESGVLSAVKDKNTCKSGGNHIVGTFSAKKSGTIVNNSYTYINNPISICNKEKEKYKKEKERDDWFNKFWVSYPKKVKKQSSFKKFSKVCKTESKFSFILNCLDNYKQSIEIERKTGFQRAFLDPTTFLNNLGDYTEVLKIELSSIDSKNSSKETESVLDDMFSSSDDDNERGGKEIAAK